MRAAAPSVVVETGVCYGFSSTAILSALEDNRKGHLWSIDLPTLDPNGRINSDGVRDTSHVVAPVGVGAAIPEDLRERWTLVPGDSEVELPRLLAQLGEIDFFFHDAEHSYRAMMREFTLAWERLAPGGVLASDDITWTRAFQEFAGVRGLRPVYFPRALYLQRKLLRRNVLYRGWVRKPSPG
ncbi:hypothetical protein B2A_12574 [mine drainage metagenome]|uniref:Class I SAM-dependent methyltransferase n=1 Tax=mine drainage metagenome TaxID=410659 RepID=T1A1V7_9ZZZZ